MSISRRTTLGGMIGAFFGGPEAAKEVVKVASAGMQGLNMAGQATAQVQQFADKLAQVPTVDPVAYYASLRKQEEALRAAAEGRRFNRHFEKDQKNPRYYRSIVGKANIQALKSISKQHKKAMLVVNNRRVERLSAMEEAKENLDQFLRKKALGWFNLDADKSKINSLLRDEEDYDGYGTDTAPGGW